MSYATVQSVRHGEYAVRRDEIFTAMKTGRYGGKWIPPEERDEWAHAQFEGLYAEYPEYARTKVQRNRQV